MFFVFVGLLEDSDIFAGHGDGQTIQRNGNYLDSRHIKQSQKKEELEFTEQ